MKVEISVGLVIAIGVIIITIYLIKRISNYFDNKLKHNIKSEKQKIDEALENFDNFNSFDIKDKM